MTEAPRIRSTTICAVRLPGEVAVGGDGQVSFGNTILKGHARKVRRLYQGRVLTGFAGATADAFTLYGRLEAKLDEFGGNLTRACVELAKDWRTDKYLRRLEALLIACDQEKSFILSGSGDVIEPDDGICAIGSGGPYALAAARAITRTSSGMRAREIVEASLKIAGEICVFTNDDIAVETLEWTVA